MKCKNKYKIQKTKILKNKYTVQMQIMGVQTVEETGVRYCRKSWKGWVWVVFLKDLSESELQIFGMGQQCQRLSQSHDVVLGPGDAGQRVGIRWSKVQEVCEVWGSVVSESFEGNEQDLDVNSVPYFEPVKVCGEDVKQEVMKVWMILGSSVSAITTSKFQLTFNLSIHWFLTKYVQTSLSALTHCWLCVNKANNKAS